MRLFKINLFNSILITLFLLEVLMTNIFAETSFLELNDNFIMGSSTMGEVNEGTINVIMSGGGSCIYKWNCTIWSECLKSGKQIRNCANIGTCSDTYKPPEIDQNCTYPVPRFNNAGEVLKKENVTEKKEAIEKKTRDAGITGKIIWNDFEDKNKILVYSIIILTILFIIFYIKKDYFKKLIKK